MSNARVLIAHVAYPLNRWHVSVRQLLLKQALNSTAGAFMLVCGMGPRQQACCISGRFLQGWCSTPVEELLVLLAGGLH